MPSIDDSGTPSAERLPQGNEAAASLPVGNEDGVPRMHHYSVCWRMGFHPSQGDFHRPHLDDCVGEMEGGRSYRSRYTPSSSRFPRERGSQSRLSPNRRRPMYRSSQYSMGSDEVDELDM